jgi:hypothetical protein
MRHLSQDDFFHAAGATEVGVRRSKKGKMKLCRIHFIGGS